MKSFNKLKPAEAERLALLLEELGEAQQAIGKILRHGYEQYSPDDFMMVTNRKALVREIGDVQAAIKLMTGAGDLNADDIFARTTTKLCKVGKYLHHQKGVRYGLIKA